MAKKYGVLVVLACVLLLCLLTAVPASAGTTVNAVQGMVTGLVSEGTVVTAPDGTEYHYGWIGTAVFYRATGADGWRFLGYGAVCLNSVIPPKGDHHHEGIIVFTSADPLANWDPGLTFSQNMAACDPTWTGTWYDGITHNGRNHQASVDVTGVAGTANAGYSAHVEVNSMQFGVANWHAERYVGTPFNLLARVTAL